MAGMEIEISVEGKQQLLDRLTVFYKTVRQLKPAFEDIAARTFTIANVLAPVYSGKTKKSIRAKGSNMRAYAKAGGSSYKSHGGGIYVAMNHAGTRWDPQTPYPFMFTTLKRVTPFAVIRVQREVMQRKRDAGL